MTTTNQIVRYEINKALELRTQQPPCTGCGGRIDRTQRSHEKGHEFESQLSENNDLENWDLSLRSQMLSITGMGPG